MKKFKIYATWQEYSHIEVEADSKEKAIEKAEENPENFEVEVSDTLDDGNWHIMDEMTKEI